MHGDFENLFGGGHDGIHHETDYHDMHTPDAFEEAPFFALGAADSAFHLGTSLAHPLHDTAHLHLRQHSDAQDSNGDGVSDAASRDLGLDPYSVHGHHNFDVNWQDAGGHLHTNHGRDSDGDGWSDHLESAIGTDPHNSSNHPSLVEARHYPEGSDENLPGTYDATHANAPWQSL